MLKQKETKGAWHRLEAFFSSTHTFYIFLGAITLTILISLVLYRFTEKLLTERLQNRLIAIVSTAATNFDSVDIEKINSEKDMNKPEFTKIVKTLQKIRSANKNIQFAYLMRRSADPNIFQFIADADTLASEEELDVNENNKIDAEEQPPLPGDPYPVGDYPVLRDEAFYYPSVDRELQPDQWGMMMAAYAPIQDENGNTVAIIGMDILVDDFRERTQEALSPFLLFVIFLVSLITLQTLILGRLWNDRVEMMKELDRQKDELLGIVSHQLATPISALKWDFEMLLDGDIGEVNEEQKDFFQKLQGVTAHLSDLVSMILDVSRIQLGRIKVDRTELDLNVFFGEVLNIMQAKAKEHKVKLTQAVQEKMGTGNLDKRLMLMITENLLSNAIKYTPEGGKVKLEVKVERGVLEFSVSDTGCGIPKQDQDKIFGKLFRASNVRNVDGNGFGLYVVKGAAEAQRGKIWFVSEVGKGTTFNVELPLEAIQATK